jgi:hypothetical protein
MKRALKYLVAVAVGILVLFGAYTAFVLNWAYARAERAGIVQSFTQQGWLFKTWEGELAMVVVPGRPPEIWSFSVRDDEAVEQVRNAIGRPVVLHYTEHRGIPGRIFGETRFFVVKVREQGAEQSAAPR